MVDELKENWLDKLIDMVIEMFKLLWTGFTTILGIIFIIAAIIVWLGFFGIIPQGAPSDDEQCIPNYMGGCD